MKRALYKSTTYENTAAPSMRELFGRQRGETLSPVEYFGGKGQDAEWIISQFPRRSAVNVYCEPFCGSAKVFWRLRNRYPIEVLNDLDGRITNLFRVLQKNDKFREFWQKVAFTLPSQHEFVRATEVLESWDGSESVDAAWAVYVILNVGIPRILHVTKGDFSRVKSPKCGQAPFCKSHLNRTLSMLRFHERLLNVQVLDMDALKVIQMFDSTETLFYVDPPYVTSTRTSDKRYCIEMDDDDHRRLIETLLNVKGFVILIGTQ